MLVAEHLVAMECMDVVLVVLVVFVDVVVVVDGICGGGGQRTGNHNDSDQNPSPTTLMQ